TGASGRCPARPARAGSTPWSPPPQRGPPTTARRDSAGRPPAACAATRRGAARRPRWPGPLVRRRAPRACRPPPAPRTRRASGPARSVAGGPRGQVAPRRLLGLGEPAARVGVVGVPGLVLGRQEIVGGPTGPADVVASGGGEWVGEGGVRPPVPFVNRLLGGGES